MVQTKPRYQGHHGRSVRGGYVTVIEPAEPAQGEDLVYAVPDGEIWFVKTISCSVQETSGGGSTNFRLSFANGSTGTRFYNSNEFSIAASQARTIVWGDGIIRETTGPYRTEPLPNDLALPPGTVITIHAGGNSQILQVAFLIELFAA